MGELGPSQGAPELPQLRSFPPPQLLRHEVQQLRGGQSRVGAVHHDGAGALLLLLRGEPDHGRV